MHLLPMQMLPFQERKSKRDWGDLLGWGHGDFRLLGHFHG